MLKIVIPGKLPGLNEYTKACRGNKYAGANLKAQAETILSFVLKQQRPKVPLDYPIVLSFFWYEPNGKRDPDNICFAKKFILDTMVRVGIIPNDTMKYINGFVDHFSVDGKNPRIEIEVWEAQEIAEKIALLGL